MKHLHAAVAIIEAANLAESGVDLYLNTMPHDVEDCVMLKDPVVGADIDEEQEGFARHNFSLVVRSKNPDTGWQKAYDIGEALRVHNHLGDGVEIRGMYPLKLPSTFHFGDSDEQETVVLMRVWFKLI